MISCFSATHRCAVTASAGAKQLSDLAGRTVTVPDKVERIIIGEGRYIPALAILDRQAGDAQLAAGFVEFNAAEPPAIELNVHMHAGFPLSGT